MSQRSEKAKTSEQLVEELKDKVSKDNNTTTVCEVIKARDTVLQFSFDISLENYEYIHQGGGNNSMEKTSDIINNALTHYRYKKPLIDATLDELKKQLDVLMKDLQNMGEVNIELKDAKRLLEERVKVQEKERTVLMESILALSASLDRMSRNI